MQKSSRPSRAQGSGFSVQGSGSMVQSLGFSVECLGSSVQGLGKDLPAAAATPWSNRAAGAGDTLGDVHALPHSLKSDDGGDSEP